MSDDSLCATYADGYGKKLALVDRAHRYLDLGAVHTLGVLVVGSRSVGKSSVLERLTGISFPTGAGLCTRTPTIVTNTVDPTIPESRSPTHGFIADVADNRLYGNAVRCTTAKQLRNVISSFAQKHVTASEAPGTFDPSDDANNEEESDNVKTSKQVYGGIAPSSPEVNQKDIKGTSSSSNTISRNREHIQSVSSSPIYIRLARRSGPAMTLIDLPGISDAADEAFDLHRATTEMARKYAADERLLILVVIPAGDDFSNSEALRIASEYDPEGRRTLCVVTKCDLVTAASDAGEKANVMQMAGVQLVPDFIAVRNRAAGDTGDTDELESQFFTENPQFRKLRPEQRGIRALMEKVFSLHGAAVERFFSNLRSQIQEEKALLQQKLSALLQPPGNTDAQRDAILDVLTAIHTRISLLIHTEDMSNPALNIPACTNDACTAFKGALMARLPNCLTDAYASEVRGVQTEACGRLLPGAVVDTVVEQQVRQILFGGSLCRSSGVVQPVTERLINDIAAFMRKCYQTIIKQECDAAHLPFMSKPISDQLASFMALAKSTATSTATAIIDAERSACFTHNTLYTFIMTELTAIVGHPLTARASGEERRIILRALLTHDSPAVTMSPPSVAAVETLRKDSRVLPVVPDLFHQDNISVDDYLSFLDDYISEASQQSDVAALMHTQFSIHTYLHIVVKRLCDVIPMVARNTLVHKAHKQFVPSVSKHLLRAQSVFDAAMGESPRNREGRKALEERLANLDSILKKMPNISTEGQKGQERDALPSNEWGSIEKR